MIDDIHPFRRNDIRSLWQLPDSPEPDGRVGCRCRRGSPPSPHRHPEGWAIPTDEDFLRKLLDNPADEQVRLVYADWLEERGDEISRAKAAFLRLEVRMAVLPERSLNRVLFRTKLLTLAAQLEPDWLAAVSHPPLEACRLRFEFQCPQQWERLTATADVRVRICDTCKQTVHYCDTVEAARRHAAHGRCVAVSLALVRRSNDITPSQPAAVTPGRLWPDILARFPVAGMLSVEGVSGPEPRRLDPDPDPPRDRPRRRRGSRPSRRKRRPDEWEDES